MAASSIRFVNGKILCSIFEILVKQKKCTTDVLNVMYTGPSTSYFLLSENLQNTLTCSFCVPYYPLYVLMISRIFLLTHVPMCALFILAFSCTRVRYNCTVFFLKVACGVLHHFASWAQFSTRSADKYKFDIEVIMI